MAKQTFTTGSVLTAQQMNDLQTNDFNQTVNQKSASYVLVASDKGTRIEMNSGSATTVTVNTGLFAAGDTLFIQNIGAGVCTVTAGTATVNRAANASLALAQWQGGYLYFISASSAIFFADAGFTSPLTTKGDLFTWDTGNARLPVGTNGQVLTAQSGQATGLQWATPSSGSLTLLSTTTLSGSSTSISVTPTGYNNLYVLLDNPTVSSTTGLGMRLNGITSTSYSYVASVANGNPGFTTNGITSAGADGALFTGNVTFLLTSSARGKFWCNIYDPNDSSGTRYKTFNFGGTWENNSNFQCSSMGSGGCNTAGAVSSIQFYPPGQTWNGGTVYVYGVK